MLSSSAFNALLKTLEEPPEHVKFIFATTETRKVPVTVLSRCQRFDLRRVDAETLITHFNSVASQESATVAEGAMGLIARAADGSVRDGLSLLDQAIAHAGNAEGDEVSEEAVREMLGLADGGLIYDLFAAAMQGTVDEALTIFNQLYDAGADPAIVLQDLLQLRRVQIKNQPAFLYPRQLSFLRYFQQRFLQDHQLVHQLKPLNLLQPFQQNQQDFQN